MESENQAIKCKTFWDAEEVIKKTEDKIKVAKSSKERQYYAEDILVEVENLLLCTDFIGGNPDCISCHSKLRNYIKEYKYLAEESRRRVVKG